MKFSQIKYKRPDFGDVYNQLDKMIDEFAAAKDVDAKFMIYDKICSTHDDFDTQFVLARVRHYLNTNDEFYKAENEIFFKEYPVVSSKFKRLRNQISKIKNKKDFYRLAGYTTELNNKLYDKSFSENILEEKKEENRLTQEYVNLISKLTVEFEGETMPLSMLASYKEHPDREIRKRAFIAEGNCYKSVKSSLDDIFDKLVKNRTQQAKKLGAESFLEIGYARMTRNCYNHEDVSIFKQQVIDHVVPIASTITQNRCRRLELDRLSIYDQQLSFKDGSAKPRIEGAELIAAAKKMYNEMSPKIGTFINMMIENELFDVYSKIGKTPGGFCSYLPSYKYPFIFANFNSTSSDVNVFTHEAGHAFARYINASNPQERYTNTTMDISETHSMAMEFLTTPWYHLFFKQDTDKYKLSHAEDAILFIPYSCQVDEFQEQIYLNPNLTPKQRDEKWLEIERIYRPDFYTDNIPFYSDGAGWQRQAHIYKTPFYYIDYGLAQVMALQFFALSLNDYDAALKLYMDFVGYGNTKTFIDVVNTTGLVSPLKSESIKPIVESLHGWIKENSL